VTSSVPVPVPGPIPGPDAALLRDVTEEVAKNADLLVDVRRDLHAHPELSWTEDRTASVVAKRLDEVGLVAEPMPRGGLLVDIGTGDGPLIALRADLDALPVDDRTDDPWASTVKGVAHACGHDVHTASLLGAGLALAGSGAYGLAATVLTPSMEHAMTAAEELEVGTVKVNAVFGGAPGGAAHPRRGSGQGFGYGPELLDELTATKAVHIGPPPSGW